MNIAAVTPRHLPAVWPRILEYIQKPLEYESGGLTPERIYELVEQGTYVLLVAWQDKEILAAQTAEIIKDPQGRVMNLVTTGGHHLELWQDEMIEVIDRLAREQRCVSIRTRGRMGWLRQLKRNGYKPLYYIAEKRIDKCQ
jgi:hypothetical protein